MTDRVGRLIWLCGCALLLCLSPLGAHATPTLSFTVTGGDENLTSELRAASLIADAIDQEETGASQLASAALADYRRLVETLYANGYYSGVVRIQLNGREAAGLPLLQLPETISQISVTVDPGRPFRFGTVSIGPIAPADTPPEALRTGETARASILRGATRSVITGWREAGYAKAELGDQRVVANHAQLTLDADIRIIPGPQVRFGSLVLTSPSAVRQARIRRIAGLDEGTVFSPEDLERVVTRLRRTGTFSSVSITEGDVNPDGTMDIVLSTVDRKPRRYGFGAELTSNEGMNVTAYWLHRNLFGGAERLRIDAEVEQIGGQDNEIDYTLSSRLTIPAYLNADTDLYIGGEIEVLDEPRFTTETVTVGTGVKWYARNGIEAEAGVAYLRSSATTNAFGSRDFRLLVLPGTITWDRRDDVLNPTRGIFLKATAAPYLGLSGSEDGLRTSLDARAYRSFGDGRVVLAGRLQFGSVLGSSLAGTYPDFLFYSGGGDTVRGQPYQSLGVDIAPGLETGGRSFLGTMLELRTRVTDRIGAVAFADAGYIGRENFYDGSGEWHAGAGLGVRYNTGLGPLRLDIATPVSGDTGDGVQVYIGIGQAF